MTPKAHLWLQGLPLAPPVAADAHASAECDEEDGPANARDPRPPRARRATRVCLSAVAAVPSRD